MAYSKEFGNYYNELLQDLDFSNCDAVLRKIKYVVDENNVLPEQKLHALGLILDKNKEVYLNYLNKKINKLNTIIENSENGELIKKYKVMREQYTFMCSRLHELEHIEQSRDDIEKENKKLKSELNNLKKTSVNNEKRKVVIVKRKA